MPTPIETAHYNKLIGRTIIAIQWQGETPLLLLSRKDSPRQDFIDNDAAYAAVQCDPEGNGPGHLEHNL